MPDPPAEGPSSEPIVIPSGPANSGKTAPKKAAKAKAPPKPKPVPVVRDPNAPKPEISIRTAEDEAPSERNYAKPKTKDVPTEMFFVAIRMAWKRAYESMESNPTGIIGTGNKVFIRATRLFDDLQKVGLQAPLGWASLFDWHNDKYGHDFTMDIVEAIRDYMKAEFVEHPTIPEAFHHRRYRKGIKYTWPVGKEFLQPPPKDKKISHPSLNIKDKAKPKTSAGK